ncbi:MAG TPA: hypothetical protein VH083_00335, partial [Myxococcales bacterium]|nr:hypothetical protein [Myxococcales bacterium]
MTRRLYLRLYAAFLGVLLAVALITTAINVLIGRPFFGFVRGGSRMAAHLARALPPADNVPLLAKAVEEIHDELDVDIVVLDPAGKILASAGTPISLPGELALIRARKAAGWLPERGIVGAPVRGPPGTVLLARLPVPEGANRAQVIRT